MLSMKLKTLVAFLLAFLISSSGAQQLDAHVGRNTLNNNSNINLKCVAKCTHDLKRRSLFRDSNVMCARAKEVKLGLIPYHACMKGKDNAFTQVCTADCATTSDDDAAKILPLMKSSAEACKKWKTGMRERYIWCKQGYNQSWEKLSSVISRINEEKSVENEESVKDLTDTNQYRDISRDQVLVQEVDHAIEEQLKCKVEEPFDRLVDESVEELADTRDISQAQRLVQDVDHAMEEPFNNEVEESVRVGESVELEKLPDIRNISQAQGLVQEVDHAVVEKELESKSEESGDKSVKYLAFSAKLLMQEAKQLVQEFEQTKEERLQIKVEFQALGRNTDFGSTSTCQVEKLALGLNNSCVHGNTQSKEITSGTKHSPVLQHGVAGAEAIAYLEYFTSNKASTGTGHVTHFYTPESEWSRRYIYGLGSGSGNNHDSALQLQTRTDMGEVDTNHAWNISSAYFSCIRTEVANHMWHPRHKLFANYDDGEGGANILAAQSGDIFQFIDTGPAGHASSSKSFTWKVHLFWVTRLSLGDLLLLEPSSDIPLQQINKLRDPWQHLHLPERQQFEQERMDITEHFRQRVEPKIAFTSHEFISAMEVILYFEPQLGSDSELRGRASPISMKIIASVYVLKQLFDNRIKELDDYFPSALWIQYDAIDHLQLILNQQFSNDTGSSLLCYPQLTYQHRASRERKALRREPIEGCGYSIQFIDTALEPCALYSNQIILLLRTHVFKETDAYATQAQVLYNATILSASKSVPMEDETANEQCQSDYRESYGLGDFVDPLAFESSNMTAQLLLLQPSLGRLSHAWLVMSRRMPLDSLSSRAPNITARSMDLDEGDSESLHSGGYDRTHAPFSSYEVFLSMSMLSDQVVSDAESTIIASMYQTGWDDYHLKRDAPRIGYVSLALAFVLLVLHCYYCPGMSMRMRRTLESPIAGHVVILEAFEKSSMEWEQRRQQTNCITPQLNMIDIKWVIASKILANKALRSKSKFELGRLHSESGPCWTRFGHRGRHRRNCQRLLRVGVGGIPGDAEEFSFSFTQPRCRNIDLRLGKDCSIITLSIFRFSLSQRAGGEFSSTVKKALWVLSSSLSLAS